MSYFAVHVPTQYEEGLEEFEHARARALRQALFGFFTGRRAELLNFEEVRTRLHLREESYKGLHDVPLDQISGSVGRHKDFTSGFLPKSDQMRDRWSRVYEATHQQEGLPPVELYKVGQVYFVRDGHHRVSVARQLGATTIQARVTELPTEVELYPGMSQREFEAAAAYAEFLDTTGLARARPYHEPLTLSDPALYGDLLRHVEMYQRVLEQSLGQPVPLEAAALGWYDDVYLWALAQIRRRKVVYLNGHTQADVYLWLVEHVPHDEHGQTSAEQKLAGALAAFLKQYRLPAPQACMG